MKHFIFFFWQMNKFNKRKEKINVKDENNALD